MPTIITLSETRLNTNIELNITNYVLYESDRCSRGESVAIYVSSDLVGEIIVSVIEPLRYECIFS